MKLTLDEYRQQRREEFAHELQEQDDWAGFPHTAVSAGQHLDNLTPEERKVLLVRAYREQRQERDG